MSTEPVPTEVGGRLVPPVAAGTRTEWSALPAAVRDWVGGTLGSPVVSARTQSGGFSPGVAARLTCADGRRAFVKAVSTDQNPVSPDLYRREATVTGALPEHPSLPTLLASYDDGHWVALLLADVTGRQPALPWRRDELGLVLDTLEELSTVLDPCPVPDPPDLTAALAQMRDMWRVLAGSPPDDLDPWLARHLDRVVGLAEEPLPIGRSLVHLDLRADNLLITERAATSSSWTGRKPAPARRGWTQCCSCWRWRPTAATTSTASSPTAPSPGPWTRRW